MKRATNSWSNHGIREAERADSSEADRPTGVGPADPGLLAQVRAGAATGTGRLMTIRLPSESLNYASFEAPMLAMPLTVLSPGVSYSSNLTPLA